MMARSPVAGGRGLHPCVADRGAGNMISDQPRFTLEEPNTAPLHDAQEISN